MVCNGIIKLYRFMTPTASLSFVEPHIFINWDPPINDQKLSWLFRSNVITWDKLHRWFRSVAHEWNSRNCDSLSAWRPSIKLWDWEVHKCDEWKRVFMIIRSPTGFVSLLVMIVGMNKLDYFCASFMECYVLRLNNHGSKTYTNSFS